MQTTGGVGKKSSTAAKALIISAFAWLLMRCLVVSGSDGRTPFLSANDRSRWCTVVALVHEHRYEIDNVIQRPGWDTIDKVYHVGSDGQPHYYSSKPPLFPTLMALPYAALRAATGLSLTERPFLVGRMLIFVINAFFLWLLFGAVARVARRYCATSWGTTFAIAIITWGTFLTTFAVTINNHLPAAAMIAVALERVLSIWLRARDELGNFFVAGLTSALAASFELPALSYFALVFGGLVAVWPKRAVFGFVPPALLIAAAFFATNWQAHQTLAPAYAHREAGADWRTTNWYNYPNSYWLEENRRGVDRGEPSVARYGFHTLLGHHGVFSLTPLWLLSAAGLFYWAGRGGGLAFVLLILACTLATLVFYILLRGQGDRNYGGVTCGFRWAFWLIPMFVVALMPVADRMSRGARPRAVAYFLLAFSAASAAYGSFHPWTHPWIYALLGYS